MQAVYQDIGRYQSAAEIHGKYEEHGNSASGTKLFSGKRISTEHGHYQIQQSAHYQIIYRVCKTGENLFVFKYGLISAKGRTHRKDENLATDNGLGI